MPKEADGAMASPPDQSRALSNQTRALLNQKRALPHQTRALLNQTRALPNQTRALSDQVLRMLKETDEARWAERRRVAELEAELQERSASHEVRSLCLPPPNRCLSDVCCASLSPGSKHIERGARARAHNRTPYGSAWLN